MVLMSGGIPAVSSVRIKDIATLKGYRKEQLVGYSLVVGLDGTGDGRRSLVTSQAVRNMLQNFGITVNDDRLYTRNVAAVMVTAHITPFSKKGSMADVIVSSLGDASSLEGGTLLMTPLVGKNNQVYAFAQGSVSIGGVNIETIGGERYRKNYALVGRVPDGAVIEKEIPVDWGSDGTLELVLKEPDFTTVSRMATAIDSAFGSRIATPLDAASLSVQIPDDFSSRAGIVTMVASLESITVSPDQIAKVVINERTGTVVIGKNVKLTTAAVVQGNLTVKISAFPVISQPQPFSQGQTVVVPQTVTDVSEQGGDKVMVLNEPATVSDLAKTLNALNVSARDIISIFQALKQSGSLKARLVIM